MSIPSKFIRPHMEVAKIYAKLSICKRLQVGAILVQDNNIIAIGYNGLPAGSLLSCEDIEGNTRPEVIHAEDNCLRKLRRSSDAIHACMVVNFAPCLECSYKIVDSGISFVYYEQDYRSRAGIDYLVSKGVQVYKIIQGD